MLKHARRNLVSGRDGQLLDPVPPLPRDLDLEKTGYGVLTLPEDEFLAATAWA